MTAAAPQLCQSDGTGRATRVTRGGTIFPTACMWWKARLHYS